MEPRVIAVTGAASGIGRAVALRAAAGGARVGVFDVNQLGAERVCEEIAERGGITAGIACDVASEEAVRNAFNELEDQLGSPTALFTGAGIDAGGKSHELPLNTWEQVLSVNLTGTFLCCRQALRAFLRRGDGGSIVCCSSPAASVAYPAGGAAAYSASKAGVSALVRSLAIEYARYGIRVNAIVPGATDTPLMWATTDPGDRESLHAQVSSEVPLGRLADPVEPADAVLWLLSDQAAYVTGSHLVCDGGVLAKASISF